MHDRQSRLYDVCRFRLFAPTKHTGQELEISFDLSLSKAIARECGLSSTDVITHSRSWALSDWIKESLCGRVSRSSLEPAAPKKWATKCATQKPGAHNSILMHNDVLQSNEDTLRTQCCAIIYMRRRRGHQPSHIMIANQLGYTCSQNIRICNYPEQPPCARKFKCSGGPEKRSGWPRSGHFKEDKEGKKEKREEEKRKGHVRSYGRS